MNLEFHEYLYILIGYIIGSLISLIVAIESWGAPKGPDKIQAYILVVLSSWLFVLIMYTRKDKR